MSKKMWRPQKVGPSRRPDPIVIPDGFEITKCPPGVADAKPPLSKYERGKADRKEARKAAKRARAKRIAVWVSNWRSR